MLYHWKCVESPIPQAAGSRGPWPWAPGSAAPEEPPLDLLHWQSDSQWFRPGHQPSVSQQGAVPHRVQKTSKRESSSNSSAGSGDPDLLQTPCEVQWASRHIWQWWAKAFSSSWRTLPHMDVLCTSAIFKPPVKKCKWLKEPDYDCMPMCGLATFCLYGFFLIFFSDFSCGWCGWQLRESKYILLFLEDPQAGDDICIMCAPPVFLQQWSRKMEEWQPF